MRIVSFNVNGIRAIRDYYVALGIGFDAFLSSLNAEIICFQEHKTLNRNKLDFEITSPSTNDVYFAFPHRPRAHGYSGVVTYIRRNCLPVITVEDGFSGVYKGDRILECSYDRLLNTFSNDELKELDGEARCIITDHGCFVLLNVYFPNDGGIERNAFRMSFYEAIRLRCLGLRDSGASVLIAGDINTTYHPRDHCEYAHAYTSWVSSLTSFPESKTVDDSNSIYVKEIIHSYVVDNKEIIPIPDFLREFYAVTCRRWLYKLIHVDGFIDTFRVHHSDTSFSYTCWNQKIGARGTNYGTRIDTILLLGKLWESDNCKKVILDSGIMPKVMGSDHCPVFVDLCDGIVIDKSLPLISSLQSSSKGIGPRQSRLTSFFKPISVGNSHLENGSINLSTKRALSSKDNQDQQQQSKTRRLCKGHQEPCKRTEVRKKGPNRGKWFYTCSRPVGGEDAPIYTDDGKKYTQYICDHFEWE